MYSSRRLLLSVAIAFMGSDAVWAIRPVEVAPLAAGFAHGDITPKLTKEKPVWIAGYGQNRPAIGVHDPLFCRVVVLDDGDHKFALASVDLIGLQYPAVLKIRAQLPEFDYVLVASTHNHEGPDVIGMWGPSPFRSGVDPEYVEFVIARVVETVRQAARKTKPVRAAFGTSTDETMLRDSRLPNVVDGVLRVVYFTTLGTGEAAGILVQWNCHPEALGAENQQLTADFPCATVTALEKQYNCPVVYFTGAVGGLMTTPKTIKNPGGPDLREGNFAYAETYGRAVARLTQKGIDQAEPVSLSPLAVTARPILLPLANPLYRAGRAIGVMTREAFVWQGDSEKLGPPATSRTQLDELAIKTEVACMQLGQVRVAAIPGEIYPELVYGKFQDPADPGADFPDAPLEPAVMNVPEGKRTLLFGMANDEVGYIIPKRQWDQMPPFAYGRQKSQYGEINSCGPETAPILMRAWRRRVQELQAERPPDPEPRSQTTWKVGAPIVTYWAGPPMTDKAARQMAEGGFNLVWCTEQELDVAQRHGLRAQLSDGLLSPATLDNSTQRERLDALIARVRNHPALYSYYITDEPSAAGFPPLGRLVAYLRERDPAHLAYINLFPTYANNDQLGTSGDTVTAYREHLRQYIEIVKPSLVSYDHYQFATEGDLDGYFLNLAMIQRAAQDAGVPFLNIVQACSWTPARRVPQGDEMRYLVYTTLAYGAQGISYYVYCHPGHTGGIAQPDGTPTPIYHALKTLNREFVAIAGELQRCESLAVYHAGMTPPGTRPLPADAPFRLDPPAPSLTYNPPERARGVLLGYFGKANKPSHVVVVNLDYKAEAVLTMVGPDRLDTFDATTGAWSPIGSPRAELRLPPGGGKLVRMSR